VTQTHEQRGPSTRRRAAVHLLWAVPLGVVVAAGLYLLGYLERCGLGACDGGGFSHLPAHPVTSALLLAASALALGAPLAAVPWAGRPLRWVVGGCVSVGWFVWVWSQLG
jgi:hypothetical protein